MARLLEGQAIPICPQCGFRDVEITKSNGARYTRPLCSTCYRGDTWRENRTKTEGKRDRSKYEYVQKNNAKRNAGKSDKGKYRCENPFCNVFTNNVFVHHLDSNHQNNHASNLIVLCKECHEYETYLHNDNLGIENSNRRMDYAYWVLNNRIGPIVYIFKKGIKSNMRMTYDIRDL